MMSGWQPIETAPRDGTDVLLFGRCAWRDSVDDYDYEEPQCIVGYYDEYSINEFCEGGAEFGSPWRSLSFNPYQDTIHPTHWMPLPAPPQSERFDEYGHYGENNPPVMSGVADKDYGC